MRNALSFLSLNLGLTLMLSATAQAAPTTQDFQQAQPDPIGKIAESTAQLKIRFPAQMVKKDAFQVTCLPVANGSSSWADNDSLWTYDFQSPTAEDSPTLVGGSKCQVTQTQDVSSIDGKTWKAGTLNYSVIVSGPNVTRIMAADEFNGDLRENEPVLMILFDGPVDRTKFFAESNGYLGYLSANAPAEKMPLSAVPQAQEEEIFNLYNDSRYLGLKYTDQNWILATVKQALIPGAQTALTIQNQTSAVNPDVHNEAKTTQEFAVRGQFKADISCDSPTAKNANCMPQSPISVVFNAKVKWADVKDSYIEYIPFKSQDRKTVRSYPDVDKGEDGYSLAYILKVVGQYIPYVAQFSDERVDHITFTVNIEPQTQAKVVLPSTLVDVDARKLSNAIAEFYLRIGSMDEEISVPRAISFFEKNVPKLYMPVAVVNLNQKLTIRKSGTDGAKWTPITDVNTMIQLIRAYATLGEYRSNPSYESPLEKVKIPTSKVDLTLSGTKNRVNYLQFPFGDAQQNQVSGLYAIEISSPTYEAGKSDRNEKLYFNPKHVLAQVTDLAVHLKKGTNQTLAWVTHLSNAQPVADAQIEIYNCLGEKVSTTKTNGMGLVTFANGKTDTVCQTSDGDYSPYLSPSEFFVVARSGGDFTLTHTSWTSEANSAYAAPGVEYVDNDIIEDQPHFQAVIGVNLVKPGQLVPIQLIAKTPDLQGFSEVPASALPVKARIVNADDTDVFYEFDLTWVNGSAQIAWNVPSDSSVKLGRYEIDLAATAADASKGLLSPVSNGDIEVAEFKIPLMSGIIAFPAQSLVQPDSIPVNAVIRYANGVGAKGLAIKDLSYYFEPTSFHREELTDFNFGSGVVKLVNQTNPDGGSALPGSSRPTPIEGLSTDQNGALSRDIALEKVADGRSVAEVLKTLDRPQTLVVRVRYQDQMGEYQTLSQAKDIFNSNQYVGTSLISGARAQAKLRAAVMDVDGKIVTAIDDLDLKVFKVDTKVIGEELFGGLIKNTIERELKDVRWPGGCTSDGQIVSCPVGALQAGSYAFQVISKSTKQAANTLFKVDTDGRVYADGDYYNYDDEENGKQLPLALDKKTYKHGDKATVSFPAPFKTCQTLVSVERSDVMQAWVVTDACDKGSVQVPVDATDAPNAYVSIYSVTGRAQNSSQTPKLGERDMGRPTYRLGFANMKVDWSKYKANVVVKTDKPKYEPGDMVNVQVNVTPEEGQLGGGTVTLVVIEEKILELKKNDTYNILDTLMQLRSHTVDTITALERVQTVTGDNPDLPTDPRKGGDEGGDGSDKGEFKRKLFNALVNYQMNVPVVNGVATFKPFKANDSLTKFKVIAIAMSPAQKFGTGSTEYLSEKDTQSYSNIPTVAHTGDQYPIKVTVQNNSGKDRQYRTEVILTVRDSNGNIIETKTMSQTSTIPNASSSAVDVGNFQVNEDATQISYVVNVYDEAGNLVDSMEPDPQVILPAVPLAIHDSFLVQVDSSTFTQNLVKESDALAGKGEIRAVLSKSLVTGALAQITKRLDNDTFADFFIESRVYKALLLSSEQKPEPIKAVLGSLLGYVDDNGFVKYYPQAYKGDIWLTANIINALQDEPWSLQYVPAALVEKLSGAVSQVLTRSVTPDYLGGNSELQWLRAQSAMGRAAYAFSDTSLRDAAKAVAATADSNLKQNPAFFGLTLNKWENSDLLDYWILQVFTSPSTALNSVVYKELTSGPRLTNTGNIAQLSGGPSYSYFYSDETIQSAELLYGVARLKGPGGLARNLAGGLVNASHNKWYVSSTMLNVASALKAFGRGYESATVTGTALLAVVEENKSVAVNWDKSQGSELRTPFTQDKATVQVHQSGTGSPWLAVQALTAVPLTQARGQGISLSKSTRNITHGSGYQTGDIIEVTINVQASSSINHVGLLDPIPAGSNIVGEAYGYFSSGEKSYSGYKLYFETLPMGLTTITYQYQLNNPGSFKLPPTRAEGLYLPSVFGETPNATLTVE